jgi:hypothetical protein
VLALGIGAGPAVFTLINSIVLRPLPYPDSHQLVLLAERAPGDVPNAVAPATYLDWQAEARSFSRMCAIETALAAFTGAGRAERIPALRATARLFEISEAQRLLSARRRLVSNRLLDCHGPAVQIATQTRHGGTHPNTRQHDASARTSRLFPPM